MNDIPRQTLREIILQYGLTIIDNPRRVRALLFDLCGQYRREIFVLGQAQEESVAEDLLEIPDSVPLTMLVSQLTHRLVENRALSPDAARWSVEAWAYALGKPIVLTSTADSLDLGVDKPRTMQSDKSDHPGTSDAPVHEPSARLAQTQYTALTSEWSVDYYWRDTNRQDEGWDLVGQTPGRILLPLEGEYSLAPHINGDELKNWASEFAFGHRVSRLTLDSPVSDKGFSALREFSNCSDLTVDNAENLTDQGFEYIQSLPALKFLKLTWCTQVSDTGFAKLTALQQMQDLKVEWTHMTDNGLRAFDKLPALSHLGLRECKDLRGDGLQYIKQNKAIQSLDLAGNSNLQDSAIRHIGDMKQLTKLNLAHCTNITGYGLASIRQLRDLVHLSLGWIDGLNDTTLDVLSELPQLTSLSLSHNRITNSGLSRLRSVRSLAYLDLSGCDAITDRGLRSIQHLPNLTHLNINACKRLSTRGIDRIERSGLTILR